MNSLTDGELLSPTYACGHVVQTMLHGTFEQKQAQYWRSSRYQCPKCGGQFTPREVKAGHLVGVLGDDEVSHDRWTRPGPGGSCTTKHPCSYGCWLERNARRAEEYLRANPVVPPNAIC